MQLRKNELAARGYQLLTESPDAGVDIFAKRLRSHFVFFQGHPEYEALSLQREYLRDITRYLARQRDVFPDVPAGYFDAETERKLVNYRKRAIAERQIPLSVELPHLTLRSDLATGVRPPLAIFRQLARNILSDGVKLLGRCSTSASSRKHDLMRPVWSYLKARVGNRLARHLRVSPAKLHNSRPMVSFTFDDAPISAATRGAADARGIQRAGHLLYRRRTGR